MLNNRLVEGKVHMKDIKEDTHPRQMPVLVVGNHKFWSAVTSKDQLATHDDCTSCGKEFEKKYSNSRHCTSCEFKVRHEKFLALPFKEWDGITPVCIPDGDQYFFDSDEIEEYIHDQQEFDEEFPSTIDLLVCEPVPLRTLDYEYWADDMHEDWEPSKALEEAVKALNKVIQAEPTQSWFPSKIRTSYRLNKD